MLTKEQEEWINHLSDDRKIVIVPYDPRTPELFDAVEKRIHNVLGPDVTIRHCGASSLGVLGQDEIDVAIESAAADFDRYIPMLEKEFGRVQSRYPDRTRFEVRQEGKKIDLKLVDRDHPKALESRVFEEYLKTHPDDLERYKDLKAEGNGLSVRAYYRRKTEFANEILKKAKV